MRVLTFYFASGASLSWQADRDSEIFGAFTLGGFIVSRDPSITWAGLVNRLGSGIAGDGVGLEEYVLINATNQFLFGLDFFLPAGQKIFAASVGGGSSMLQLLLRDIVVVPDQV